jgi:hypothetical protein
VTPLSARDDAFLEDLSRSAFRYFLEHADPATGLVLDRARTDGTAQARIASIAATGFGLTALSIAASRRWIEPAGARERARVTLRFFAEHAQYAHGWFYHWMDAATGDRQWNSEISSIDTALLLAGVLTAGQYFHDDEIGRLARRIYERVDFQWMLAGSPSLLAHGWKPESGFLPNRWDSYCELTILYLLAIGSPAHAIPPQAWYAWRRPRMTYAGYPFIYDGPLFVHQYSHAWIDFRSRREVQPTHTDYFENSVAATRAHREFCITLAAKFPKSYGPDVWGISASDSAHGYYAWGGPPAQGPIDGTVVPCAPGGSLMFTPDICLTALRTMRERFGDRVYGRYGFADAFNPSTEWVDTDVIGIDQGITLLSAENLRSGNVWKWYGQDPAMARAMRLIFGEREADPGGPPQAEGPPHF